MFPSASFLRNARIAILLLSCAHGCTLVGYGGDASDLGFTQPGLPRVDGGSAAGDGGVVGKRDAANDTSDASLQSRIYSDGGKALPLVDGGASTSDAGTAARGPVTTLGCGLATVCAPDCTSGACDVACAGSSICITECEDGTDCNIDCKHAGICDLDCKAGATCVVDCRDARDCDHLECEEGASCTLYCANNLLGCSLSCAGVAQTCANGVMVCDAPCP